MDPTPLDRDQASEERSTEGPPSVSTQTPTERDSVRQAFSDFQTEVIQDTERQGFPEEQTDHEAEKHAASSTNTDELDTGRQSPFSTEHTLTELDSDTPQSLMDKHCADSAWADTDQVNAHLVQPTPVSGSPVIQRDLSEAALASQAETPPRVTCKSAPKDAVREVTGVEFIVPVLDLSGLASAGDRAELELGEPELDQSGAGVELEGVKIDLSGGQLTSLPRSLLARRSILTTHLYLTGNRLRSLPDSLVSCLPSLTYLDLRDNMLDTLPAGIAQLAHLQVLLLQDNRISVLPPQLALLTRLQSVSYSGNPLLFPPDEVTRAGWPRVQHYLRGLLTDADRAAISVHSFAILNEGMEPARPTDRRTLSATNDPARSVRFSEGSADHCTADPGDSRDQRVFDRGINRDQGTYGAQDDKDQSATGARDTSKSSGTEEKQRLSENPSVEEDEEEASEEGEEGEAEEEEYDERGVSEVSAEAAALDVSPCADPAGRSAGDPAGGQRRTLRLAVSMPGLEGQAGSALVSVPVPPPTKQQRQQRPGPAAGPADTGAERRQRTAETSPKKVYLSPGAAAGQRRAVPLRLVRLEPPLPSQETGRRPEVRVRSAEHHLSGIKETGRASQHPRRRQQRTKKTRKVSKWEQSAEEATRPAARVPCFPPCPELQLEPDDRQLQLRKLERQRRLWLLQRQSDTIFLSNWREKARKMQKELFFRTVKYASDGLRCGPLVTPYDSPARPLSADPLVAHCPPEPGQPTQPDAPMNVKRSWAERVRDGDQLQRDVSAVVRRIQSGQLRPASSPRGQLRESSRRLLELESLLKSLEQFRLRHPLPR